MKALGPAQAAGFPVSAGAPLLVTAGLIKMSKLAAGGNTGLLRLAVTLGKRVVMIMNTNRPGRTHPVGHPEWAVLPPPGRPITAIQSTTVIEALCQAISEAPGSGPG